MDESIINRIIEAIENTEIIIPGYFENTCESRLRKTGCGSVFTFNQRENTPIETVGDIVHGLLNSAWTPFEHPAIMEGCTAFKTEDLWGNLGVVELKDLPDDTTVILDDRKNTGMISATVSGYEGASQLHTVIILGIEKGQEVVFTFHPGDPVSPSKVKAEQGMHGKRITVKEAKELGLTTAKIVK